MNSERGDVKSNRAETPPLLPENELAHRDRAALLGQNGWHFRAHARWVELLGPDAEDFLQRISTVNVRSLAIGRGEPGFLLSAQGKIRAIFHLWRLGPEAFVFELDAGADSSWERALIEAIDQYTFGERIELRAPVGDSAPSCLWLLTPKSEAFFPGLSANASRVLNSPSEASQAPLRVFHHGDSALGSHWLSVWGAKPLLRSLLQQWQAARPAELELREFGSSALELLRIHQLTPGIDREILHEQTIPLEVGLHAAIATGKGCYPGQEVIERISALGSPARRLALLRGVGASAVTPRSLPDAGEALFATVPSPQTFSDEAPAQAGEAPEAGHLTSVAAATAEEGGFIALALLRRTQAREGAELRTAGGSIMKIEKIAAFR
jgi:hypothetical protein